MEKISLMEKNNLWICSDVFYPDQVATSHILTEIAKINLDKFNINVTLAIELSISRIE